MSSCVNVGPPTNSVFQSPDSRTVVGYARRPSHACEGLHRGHAASEAMSFASKVLRSLM
jgi:hypothetical protein